MPASEPVGNLLHETYLPWTQPVYSHVPRRSCWVASMRGSALAMRPSPAAWPSRWGIEGRSKLQCCNRSRRSAGRRCCRAGAPVGGYWAMSAGAAPRPSPSGGPSGGGDRGQGALQCCNSSVHLTGQQPLPLPSGAGSDSVGTCCWAMAMSPGWTADGGHHLVGNPVRRPGSQGRVIAGRSVLQCCNRSRHPAGRQPQPLPGGARSDPVGVLLDHGQVPGRGGAPGSSPGRRTGQAILPQEG